MATPETIECECGEARGEPCAWRGPAAEAITVEWMPPALRASHAAAGGSGRWPHNGALRLRCAPDCAEALTRVWDDDGNMTQEPDEWATVVEEER